MVNLAERCFLLIASVPYQTAARGGISGLMRFCWVNGRLGWPLVISIVFVTLSALVLDYVWRTVIIPADKLFIYAAAIELTVMVLLVALWTFVRPRFAK